MRMNPTTVLSMEDWMVDVTYIERWGQVGSGRTITMQIGTSRQQSEEQALLSVANSLRKGFVYPPILNMRARRRRQVWLDKTTERHPELMNRMVTAE